MELYSEQLNSKEEILLDLIIADRDSDFRIHDLRICLQKIITKDIFGIDKYLSPSCMIHNITIKNSSDRETYNNEVMKFADSCRLNSHVSKMIWGISEEMLMNAIYDAPASSSKDCYQNISRTDNLKLEPEDYATLSYGCDGNLFILSSSDPFGSLKKDILLNYLKKVLRRFDSASIIDIKEGGAGLGLFKILYSCHGVICNVKHGEKTEIMAIIEIDQQIKDFAKMPRSIEYYST